MSNVPGSNILAQALTVIAKQTVSYYAFVSRAPNANYLDVTTYADPVPLQGSWQPVKRELYERLGLDLQKNYSRFYVSANVIDVTRDVSGDQIHFQGRVWQCESVNPWYGVDGWVGVLVIDVGPIPPPITTCLFPLNMQQEESPYPLLTMTDEDKTGSYTVAGDVAFNTEYIAAPTGLFTYSSAFLEFTAGVRLIAWQIVLPAAEDTSTTFVAYESTGSLLTVQVAPVISFTAQAVANGLFSVEIPDGGGPGYNYQADNLPAIPECICFALDGVAGTFRAFAYDGTSWSELPLDVGTYEPANLVPIMLTRERSGSSPGDAGKVISLTQITTAEEFPDIPGLLELIPSAQDSCGVALVAP